MPTAKEHRPGMALSAIDDRLAMEAYAPATGPAKLAEAPLARAQAVLERVFGY